MSAHHKEPSIAEEAARWLVELEGRPTQPALADFASWLKASPRHIEEFLASAAAWDRFNGLDSQRTIDLGDLMSRGERAVVFVHPAEHAGAIEPATSPWRHWRWAAGFAAAALLGAGSWLSVERSHSPVYSTSVGEQRSIKLADGSLVQLNTGTRVRISVSEEAREVQLVEGEALFTVARDAVRPFRVRSGQWVVQALGTEFNVYRRDGGTTVSVVEGAVRIRAASSESTLAAGEEARIDGNGTIDKRPSSNIGEAIAWRERRLVFRDDTLEDIVSEFNRYNAGYQLELVSDAAKRLRLTGVFKADDPAAVVLYLQQNSDLTISQEGSNPAKVIIGSPAGESASTHH